MTAEYDSLTDDTDAPPPELDVVIGDGFAIGRAERDRVRVRHASQFRGVVAHHARLAAVDMLHSVLLAGGLVLLGVGWYGRSWLAAAPGAALVLWAAHWFHVRRMEHSVRRPGMGRGPRDHY